MAAATGGNKALYWAITALVIGAVVWGVSKSV